MKIKVLVATHKNYQMPSDSLYLPVFVGKEIHPDVNKTFQGDNTGDNISVKNPNYNELTALYWGWKNLDVDGMGLVHYRRYLSLKGGKSFDNILTMDESKKLLSKYDVILPKRRNYYIETNKSHYLHVHEKEPLEVMTKVIKQDYPEYVPAMEKVFNRTWAHMFNMFIMKKEILNEYCTWLFDILSKVEDQIDIREYTTYEKRVYGFLSELMLDIWLETHTEYTTHEVKYVFMEKTNWVKKGGRFLYRRIFGHGKAY